MLSLNLLTFYVKTTVFWNKKNIIFPLIFSYDLMLLAIAAVSGPEHLATWEPQSPGDSAPGTIKNAPGTIKDASGTMEDKGSYLLFIVVMIIAIMLWCLRRSYGARGVLALIISCKTSIHRFGVQRFWAPCKAPKAFLLLGALQGAPKLGDTVGGKTIAPSTAPCKAP